MSWRHRHFSVLPAPLANIVGDEIASARSQDRHGSTFATQRPHVRSTRLGRAEFRRSRRRWILTAGAVPATTPMWTSRTSWTCEVSSWAASAQGTEVLRRVHLGRKLFVRVSAALARFADGSSGRHCAVTNARVALAAGCSPRTVTTVRAVLAEAHYAVEVRRGTGSSTTAVHLRRPSVWHLTSRRQPVDKREICDLPRPVRVTGSVPLGSPSPSEAHSAPPQDSSIQKPRQRRQRHRPPPRPLHTQKLAGWLASNSMGLGARTGHHVVGQICNALQNSHLDLPAWTGPQLVQALNEDMKRRGANWPDQITSPGPFLAHRLRHLPPRPPSAATSVSPVITTHQDSETDRDGGNPPVQPSAARLAARRTISEVLARGARPGRHT